MECGRYTGLRGDGEVREADRPREVYGNITEVLGFCDGAGGWGARRLSRQDLTRVECGEGVHVTGGRDQVGGGLLRKEGTKSKGCWVTVRAGPGKWVGFGLTVELAWDVVGGLDQVKDGRGFRGYWWKGEVRGEIRG